MDDLIETKELVVFDTHRIDSLMVRSRPEFASVTVEESGFTHEKKAVIILNRGELTVLRDRLNLILGDMK